MPDQTTLLMLTHPADTDRQVIVLASEIIAVGDTVADTTLIHLRSGASVSVAESAVTVTELWKLHIESTWVRSSEI